MNLYAMLAANGPQTTTPGQYLDATPTATGQTSTGSSGLFLIAALLLATFFLFRGGHHR